MVARPNNLYEKVRDGVFSLDNIDLASLLQWSREASGNDKDVIGCEIMSRQSDCKNEYQNLQRFQNR
jgi:hypothetical protein